jgi:G3E family GTPase
LWVLVLLPLVFVQGGREAVPQWVELANGCLCCSVKAEFVQALEALLDADAGHSGKFDYVLVETTGASRQKCFCSVESMRQSRAM